MRLHIVVLLAFCLTNCVEEYAPEIDKYSEIIVIDGLLTDTSITPFVEISRSVEVGALVTNSDYYSGATVQIKSESGESYSLTEKRKGRYEYNGEEIIGKVGETFWVHIQYGGEVYESKPEEMLPVGEVTDISYESVRSSNGASYDGVNIFVSSKGEGNDSRYVGWSFDEDWKFKVPVVSNRYATKQICWSKETSTGIMIGTSEANVVNAFDDLKVYTVSTDEPKLSIRYSSNIFQYSLTRDSYKYLEHVQNVNANNGSLFDPVPASVNGNIYCSSDEDVPVIGNFQISSVTSKRIFIDRLDLPKDMYIEPGGDDCKSLKAPIEDRRMQDSIVRQGFIIMDTATIEHITYIRYAKAKGCFDCTASGAKNFGPEWWIERENN